MKQTLSLALAVTLFALTPTLAQESKLDAPLSVEVPPGEGVVQIEDLVRAWAKQTGRRAYISPSVKTLKATLGVGSHQLGRGEMLALLADHDVIIVEDSSRIRALNSREVQSKTGGHLDASRVYSGDDKLPTMNTPISLAYRIQHGAGSAIYANLRGILARDPTRGGNILYIQGAELIVISDLAPKVAYYQRLIRLLDRPLLPTSQQVTVYEVPGELWAGLKTTAAGEASTRLAKLFAERRVVRLEQARINGHRFSLERSLTQRDGARLQLQVRVSIPSPPKGAVIRDETPRLSIALFRQAKGEKGEERLERQVEVDAPPPAQAALVSAVLGAEEDSAHLVVVFTPIP